MKPTEQQIQKTIIEYLQRKKWYVQRMNSGKMAYEYGGTKRFMNLAEAGTPDIMAFKKTENDCDPCDWAYILRLLFVEVKRQGKKATPLQKAKMEELEKYGAICMVATSIEDLEKMGI